MMTPYINNLIDINIKNKYSNLSLDIVFEGGLFNGSYLAGCLLYLKQLEEKKYIKIHKISGCSIGSIVAILYFIPNPKLWIEIYQLAYTQFKEHHNINIFNTLFDIIKRELPRNIISLVHKRVYITYFNVKTGKQVIKYKYKNLDDLFETIRRSCSFPYITNNSLFYKEKYLDGLYPYIFKNKNKILYLNIHNLDQIIGMLSVKNEPTNIQRILEGIIDIHSFFVSETNTNICSFVDNWTFINKIKHFIFISMINMIFCIMNKTYIVTQIVNNSMENEKINTYKVIQNIYINILDRYFI
jgi:virulence-associated protein VapD